MRTQYNQFKTMFLESMFNEGKKIRIPDNVTKIKDGEFRDNIKITSVEISEGVTSIGGRAFSGCINLKSINIPDSVTEIGDEVFKGCSLLTNVTIGNSVKRIGESAFAKCISLKKVILPDSVTDIGNYAFLACHSLTNIVIPNGIKYINMGTFRKCSNLRKVSIPDGVMGFGTSAFHYCSSLTKVMIPDSVRMIDSYVFADCSSLTSLTIPDSVTTIGFAAIAGCSSLTNVIIGAGVKTIETQVFYECDNLQEIKVKGKTDYEARSLLSNVGLNRNVTIRGSLKKSTQSNNYEDFLKQFSGNKEITKAYISTKGFPCIKISTWDIELPDEYVDFYYSVECKRTTNGSTERWVPVKRDDLSSAVESVLGDFPLVTKNTPDNFTKLFIVLDFRDIN